MSPEGLNVVSRKLCSVILAPPCLLKLLGASSCHSSVPWCNYTTVKRNATPRGRLGELLPVSCHHQQHRSEEHDNLDSAVGSYSPWARSLGEAASLEDKCVPLKATGKFLPHKVCSILYTDEWKTASLTALTLPLVS